MFDIHTYASDLQLGEVISQYGKSTAFYSRKRRGPQTRYKIMEKELLNIVKTLKEFPTILLGQRLKVYINHKI